MSTWTRESASDLARISMQAGLEPEEAEKALMLGARLYALGFHPHLVEKMIRREYQESAER